MVISTEGRSAADFKWLKWYEQLPRNALFFCDDDTNTAKRDLTKSFYTLGQMWSKDWSNLNRNDGYAYFLCLRAFIQNHLIIG